MISVQQAEEVILSHTIFQQIESVPLEKSLNRVLAEDIRAERAVPPFDRVAMDGIAINYDVFEDGQRKFKVEGIFGAGDPQGIMNEHDACVEIMTGASLVDGADTIVRYEDVDIVDDIATINVEFLRSNQNVHHKGKDGNPGDLLIAKNRVIAPVDICILASEGKSQVLVYCTPRVGIISSGDELVEVDEMPLPHQIRRSNVYAIRSLINPLQSVTKMYHFKDEKEDIRNGLEQAFEENDVLILVGGVSKGKYDFIPDVLTEMGAEKLFHRIAQRPGKPFWFGALGSKKIFALPGNPVSSMMCTVRYFLPWLRSSLRIQADYTIPVVLAEDVNFKPELTRLLEVDLKVNKRGILEAFPQIGNGSGDFMKLAFASAFIELPAEQSEFKKGEVLKAWRFRSEGVLM